MKRLESAACAALLLFAEVPRTVAAPPKAVDFARDVAPLLEKHCIRCHQPGNAKGDLSLETSADLFDAGHVVPGKPGESGMLPLLASGPNGKKPRMPKDGTPLSPEELALLELWVADGAKWPTGLMLKERAKADRSWWSLKPLAKPTLPNPPGLPAAWAANPIDRFVFAKLSEASLTPSPPADPRKLIRRLSYDLTGLPPSPERVEAFAANPSPEVYAKLVDELLASPAYGEHWGRHWLDVVRFGESNGYERNILIDGAWPFRDYVIRSLNEDKPFDRFVLEHLAGDVVGPNDPAVVVGTTFLVCGPYDDVTQQDAIQNAVIRANTLDDMIRATGEAFLGVTVGCARCHNHKFDPITQADYYRFAAAFDGVWHGHAPVGSQEVNARRQHLEHAKGRIAAERAKVPQATIDEYERTGVFDAELAQIDKEIAELPQAPHWWVGQFRSPNPTHLFVGGDPQKKAELVPPSSPSFLSDATKGFELPPNTPERDRRLALAKWLTAGDNPLTPRVLANRVWQYHFGTGIVDTPSDFGYMGGKPTHPELLDFLAGRLLADGWRLKSLHRLIVTSQAYQQSSAFRDDAAKIDGDSRKLWRFPPRRLSGEEVRDSMLTAAGKLDLRPGGPGFRLFQYVRDNVATYHPLNEHGPETYRRAVYHMQTRATRVDVLTDFDCPDPAV